MPHIFNEEADEQKGELARLVSRLMIRIQKY